MPVVTHNQRATELRFQAMCDLYAGIMPVKKVGQTHIWCTPWDYLIRWWGIEGAMLDLSERPALVHAEVERMVDAWMAELDQFVALDGGTGPVRRPEPFVAGSRQHAHRVGRIRLHARITRTGFRSGVREAAQHVGMFERADLLGCIASHALGVRRGARPSLAVALEAG